MKKLLELASIGQSPWLDYIRKDLLETGELAKLVEIGIRGVTSNPSIFENAIAKSDVYLSDINRLACQGKDKFQIYEELAVRDIQHAANVLLPLYVASNKTDGFVSLEVSPDLCHDYERTVAEAKRLWAKVERPNLMIKVPATGAGIQALSQLIAEGISVNATLMFSRQDYLDVVEAYLKGLEIRHEKNLSLETVSSVASIFVSRIDTAVERVVKDENVKNELLGKVAVANARKIYREFMSLLNSDRFIRLQKSGAHPQRPLFASTGTKNSMLSDVLYVDQLIGDYSVNTMPPSTMKAFLDHGTVKRTVDQFAEEDDLVLHKCDEYGIDITVLGESLKKDGLKQFIVSFHKLMATIDQKQQEEIM